MSVRNLVLPSQRRSPLENTLYGSGIPHKRQSAKDVFKLITSQVSSQNVQLTADKQKNILPFKSHLNVLTNFWMEDLHFENQIFLSAEHCYQWFFCMEMNDPITAEKVFKAKSAAAAKNIAQEVKSKDFADWNRKKYR